MSHIWKVPLIFYLIYVAQKTESVIAVRKYVYQKDVSEHCRRRAFPSVFLSKQVLEANSQVLDFSRMELPYSCFISVRTESGNNIILVAQLLSDKSLISACSANADQLLVYEMGETFGGYWGALPDSALEKPINTEPKYYTKKTKPKPVTMIDLSVDSESEPGINTVAPHPKTEHQTTEDDDFIRIEVPLVNVSGKLVPGEVPPQKILDIDDVFDVLYDVTPKTDEKYDTSIIPLVQFAIQETGGGARGDGERRYQVDYEIGNFTPDTRLQNYATRSINPTRKPFGKIKWNHIKRTQPKKHQTPVSWKALQPYFKSNKYNKSRRLPVTLSSQLGKRIGVFTRKPLYSNHVASSITTSLSSIRDIEHPPQFIQDVMKFFNISRKVKDKSKDKDMPTNESELVNKISNKQHNISVYLAPDWSIYNDNGSRHLLYHDTSTKKYTVTPFSRGLLLPIYSTTQFHSLSEKPSYNSVSILLDALTNVSSKTETDTLFEFLNKKMPKNVLIPKYNETLSLNNSTNVMENNLTTNELKTEEYNEIRSNVTVNNRIVTEIMNVGDTITANTGFGSNYSANSSIKERAKLQSGTMVDHESWENIVQVAPVMAVLLNKTVPLHEISTEENIPDDSTESVKLKGNVTVLISETHTGVRKKRFLNVVPIEIARPHNLTVRARKATTPDSLLYHSDMQEFAQMVELEDDDVDGHVLLRNMGRYLGPALFNACDYREAKARYVLLFNSSRIVLAISNFTMERMTIVLTTARTLLNSEARCPRWHLECQVSGARVCIDSTSACDGVPNCGAYDIYDEDRLQCGGSAGLQHNVCLAAFTFLAALLTLLYTVHYWLKRCVPNVSSAFFIYTDGTENVLYLDSIMRSPNDFEDTKMEYQGNLIEDELNEYIHDEQQKGFFKKWSANIEKLFFWKNKLRKGDVIEISHHTYSFTELELRKMRSSELVNESVQTGESLEMTFIKQMKENESKPIEMTDHKRYKSHQLPKPPKIDLPLTDKDETSTQKQSSHELEMLRFSKETKADSLEMRARKSNVKSKSIGTGPEEETEIHNTEYLLPTEIGFRHRKPVPKESHKPIPVASRHEDYLEKPQSSGLARKRLRFEEGATTIPDPDDEEIIESPLIKRRSVFLGSRRPWRGNLDMDRVQADDGQQSGAGKDFRRFWSNPKGSKKGKKRTDYTK